MSWGQYHYSNNDTYWYNPYDRRFQKFAILLNEAPTEDQVNRNLLSARRSTLAEEILPALPLEKDLKGKDHVRILRRILEEKIRTHARIEASVLTNEKVMEEHTPSLAPIMFRIASDNFAKSNDVFKIIELRNNTKMTSGYKPTLEDVLAELGHQVIFVELKSEKNTFMPHYEFSDAILRQCDYPWQYAISQSIFYPNDVCTLSTTPDGCCTFITPAMPDGDLAMFALGSTLKYELAMIFQRTCMDALHSHLLMRDMGIGKTEDILASIAAIRSMYRKAQDQLRQGKSILLGSESCNDLQNLIKQQKKLDAMNATKAQLALAKAERAIAGLLKEDKAKTPEKLPPIDPKLLPPPPPPSEEPSCVYSTLCSGRSSARGNVLNFSCSSGDLSKVDKKLRAELDRIDNILAGAKTRRGPLLFPKENKGTMNKEEGERSKIFMNLKPPPMPAGTTVSPRRTTPRVHTRTHVPRLRVSPRSPRLASPRSPRRHQ